MQRSLLITATLEMTSNANAGSAACAEPPGAAHFGAPQERTNPQPKLNGLVNG
jgi:hypothetical protein